MITVLVGGTEEYLSRRAKNLDPNAILITDNNFENLKPGTYYTSLGDVKSLSNFSAILDQADKIIYYPPIEWTGKHKNQTKEWTEFYLLYFKDKKEISGIDHLLIPHTDITDMLNLVDKRKTPDKQIWISGCSISHGVGVDSTQRYGQIIANKLDLPVSFLTEPGSSLEWASDQLIRSDIQPGDIVIWGLTSIDRFVYYLDQIHHIHPTYYNFNPDFKKQFSLDLLDSDHSLYKAITSIYRVINFCDKLNVKLVMAGLLINHEKIDKFSSVPYYTQLHGLFGHEFRKTFIDVGSDGSHPGPLMHQWYADQILKILNK